MARVRVERFPENPIIRPHMDGRMGDNINGPSLIRVPDWVTSPLGRYYLYFGNHRGTYIRLAYADDLAGPWRTYEPGVLDLADSFFARHIASPDALVDDERREIRLYYHGPLKEADRHGPHGRHAQASRVALSRDGLHFEAREEVLGASYLRVFRYDGVYYGIAMPGILYRSEDGLSGFEEGPCPFPEEQRHVGLKLDGDVLSVFYTLKGECPERILVSRVDLRGDWREWRPSEPEVVLEPQLDYEGVNEPHVPSSGGPIDGPAYQLRDPYVFREGGREGDREGGRDYLLYSVAGEQGIAIARLEDSVG